MTRAVVRIAWLVVLACLLLIVAPYSALATFPGRNGMLVVQPAIGNGLIVVGADGVHPREICGVRTRCHGATDPVWSPDGSKIAAVSPQGSGPDVIYPDGSCFACAVPGPFSVGDLLSWDPNVGPGFLPDGRLVVSVVQPVDGITPAPQLGAVNTDGIGFQPFKVAGSWQQPAWSPTGQLAAVRSVKRKPEVFVLNPLVGSARQLTRDGANSPSWSPDGRRLAAVHDGWIELIASHGGRPRRLTRGRAPAWAPDSTELAFVGADNRLFVIAAGGGRPRAVGHIRAVRVDWQPVTGKPPSHCQAPAGSTVLAASPDATISIDSLFGGPFSVLGCLTSDGRERLLEAFPPGGPSSFEVVEDAVFAGDYAALVNHAASNHSPGERTVAVFDLRTGNTVANWGAETAGCNCWDADVDQLVLGPDAVTAAHTWVTNINCYPGQGAACTMTTVEQIVANDRSGTHVLDSITTTGPDDPSAVPSTLSQLSLSGDTLTWSHAGIPQSAQLN